MKKIFIIVLFFVTFVINIYADKVKYVFLFIGDGMSMSSEFALSNFLYGEDKSLVWNSFPIQIYMETWSKDSYQGKYDRNNFDSEKGYNTKSAGVVPYPYYETQEAEQYFRNSKATDSAAAATAMATGKKINNYGICYDRDRKDYLSNITDEINEKGEYNFALITTDRFYSATPACFSSHNVSRDNHKEIATEILSRTKPEIVAGKNFYDEINTLSELNGYYYLELSEINKPQTFSLIDKKIFLNMKRYFVPNPIENFTSESFEYRDTNKKFSNIVLYITKMLLQKKKPFFTLVEVDGIDRANHDNDFIKMLGAMYELNEAVRSIYDLINSKTTDMTLDNTIIIVTADHSTGMLRFKRYLGKGKLPIVFTTKQHDATVITNMQISYESKWHTNELVGCYSIGAKSEIFKKYINKNNIIDNTDIYNILNEIIIKKNNLN